MIKAERGRSSTLGPICNSLLYPINIEILLKWTFCERNVYLIKLIKALQHHCIFNEAATSLLHLLYHLICTVPTSGGLGSRFSHVSSTTRSSTVWPFFSEQSWSSGGRSKLWGSWHNHSGIAPAMSEAIRRTASFILVFLDDFWWWIVLQIVYAMMQVSLYLDFGCKIFPV